MSLKRFLSLILFFTLTAILYVNQQTLIYQTGERLKESKSLHLKLIDRNKLLVYNVLNLKSPSNLEKRLKTKAIVLNMPRGWEVLKSNTSKNKFFAASVKKKSGLIARLFGSSTVAEASGL